jgi:hypothetical protein
MKLDSLSPLEVAEAQIDQLERENSRPGWSLWAVLVSLCAVLWLLSTEIQANGTPGPEQLRFALAGYLALKVLFSLADIGGPRAHSRPEMRLQESGAFFGSARRILVFTLLLLLAIVVLVLQDSMLKRWHIVFLWFYVGPLLAAIATFILMSIAKFPVVVSGKKRQPKLAAGVIAYTLVSPILLATSLVIDGNPSRLASMAFARIAALISVAVFLADRLVVLSKRNPLLTSLEQIRADVSFGSIGPTEALERISIVTSGFRLEQALQADISRLMDFVHQETELCKTVKERFALILRKKTSGAFIVVKSKESEAVADSIMYLLEKLNALADRVTPRLEAFRRRVAFIAAQSSDLHEISDLVAKLQKEFAVPKDLVAEIGERVTLAKTLLSKEHTKKERKRLPGRQEP